MVDNKFSVDTVHFESLYPVDSRFDEIEKLLSFVKSGNSCQLVSLPGVGRSNIMGLLAYNREARTLHLREEESKYHFLVLNFSEIKKKPLSEVIKFLFLELVDSLEERKKEEEHKFADQVFKESLKTKDELVLFQGLRKVIDFLCLEKELTVVLMFDRFEDYLPMLTPQFFSNLRVLRDRAKYKFSVVFPLNRPLEELVEPDLIADFYEFIVGNIIYLPVKDDRILNFRLDFIEKANGKKISPKIREQIIELSGGHGKLARICVEAYQSADWQVFQDGKEANLETSLLAKNRVLSVLEEIWKALTPFEQTLIEEGKTGESSFLVAIGLVKNTKVTIPLLESYARKNAPIDDQISYDPKTKEIKKGKLILSDGLTSSEYKLLSFMIQNEGKILERNDIINAVWAELSSTAGVTEQALDQLIFRVRKKVEDNPNSPVHIQTIKGRGFKFSS